MEMPLLLTPNRYLKTEFILNSADAWDHDLAERFDLDELNQSFHESVPVLEFLDWHITKVSRGFAETKLPLNVNSSNQYITHQAALMLLAADYTGGLALTTLFHLIPVIGFWETRPELGDYGIYMWGAKATIKWHSPSCNDLVCRASIPPEKWKDLARRLRNHQKIATTVQVDMYNGNTLVAEAQFTYWAQDIENLRRSALDSEKISMLYHHKMRTTAKLIAGLRAIEQEKPAAERLCDDPYALMLAGKHGRALAQRFSLIAPQLQTMVVARTNHLDQTLLNFANSHPNVNVVNIGAGYDARFWRLQVDNAQLFELDLPVMLAERRKIFEYSDKAQLYSMPIDLRTEELANVILQDKRFDAQLPTLFIWEGGSMYFNHSDLKRIFSSLNVLLGLNKGSRCWLDYVTESVIQSTTGSAEATNFIKNMRKMGEPFIGGINDMKEFADKHALETSEDMRSSTYLKIQEVIYQHYGFSVLKHANFNSAPN